MTYIAKNLTRLRKSKNRTQDDVAFAIGLKRSTYSGYENEISVPTIEVIMKLADYFEISIDNLVRVDLTRLTDYNLRQLKIIKNDKTE
jgi:transcriptional regulator with XRE-family HTH domain